MPKKQQSTPPKKPRNARLPAEKRIADIIAAAREVLHKKDYESALISEIAEQAGVVDGTIYRYFDNKRHLFIKVAENWFEEILAQNISNTNTNIEGTLNQLRHVIWWVLSIIHKEPALTRFVLMELRPRPDYRASRVYQLNKKFTENVLVVFRQAIQSGELDNSYGISFVRDMVFGCIEHQTWSYLSNQGDFSVDELAEKIATVTYQGLLKKAPLTDDLSSVVSRLEIIADKLEGGR